MKNYFFKNSQQKFNIKTINPYWFLLIGVLTMTLAHLSWNIDWFAWFSMVPLLLFLRLTKGFKSRIIFVLVLIIIWSIIVLKIISHPIPYIFIPLYSVPIAIIHLPGYLIFGKLMNNKLSIFLFPAVMVISEWIQYSFTPLASWGVAAYTQTDSLYMAQSLSIFGMSGLSFLIYWVNVSITEIIITKERTKINFVFPLLAVVFLMVFGSLRYELSEMQGKQTIMTAAIGTESEIGGPELPSKESNEEVIKKIFERTELSANAGVELVVWNEASFYLFPEDEKAWKDSIAQLAKSNNIAVVASYVVLLSESPFKYENKYVFFDSDGTIQNEYLKHEPVPGEPAVRGTKDIITSNVNNINIGAAICYDYDFPYLAKENNTAGADIVALPSSDWRGIDPLHTKMAAFRAIEQGHSVLRSTRFGLSAAINPYGGIVSQMSSFDDNDKIMISNLPAKSIKTIYSYVGDIVVYLSIALVLFLIVQSYIKKE